MTIHYERMFKKDICRFPGIIFSAIDFVFDIISIAIDIFFGIVSKTLFSSFLFAKNVDLCIFVDLFHYYKRFKCSFAYFLMNGLQCNSNKVLVCEDDTYIYLKSYFR